MSMFNAEMMLAQALQMAHSPVHNYAIPGLTSWLIGNRADNGSLVRLFHSSREHVEPITPHSHRFGFTAVVLRGEVTNRVWYECLDSRDADVYCVSEERYLGEIGKYTTQVRQHAAFSWEDFTYSQGDTYNMSAHEIHSIYFGRDTYVLMFEGPEESKTSVILEPVVDGMRVPTFKVEDWMFQRP